MVIILSKSSLEVSTENVMDWLYCYGVPFTRINGDDIMDSESLFYPITEKGTFIYLNEGKKISVNDISVVWFRRWSDRNFLEKYTNQATGNLDLPYLIAENINLDYHVIRNFIFSKLSNLPFISNPTHFTGLNKFIVLNVAMEIGFQVPETIICNNKSELEKVIKKWNNVITKDIENSAFAKVAKSYYSTFTTVLDNSKIEEIPEKFSVSAFQQLIEKEYEIRVFYFYGKIYSMAIFSQNDPETTIDFRKYNNAKPNRNVPYSLPAVEKQKVERLMNQLDLTTGSIDLIRTKDGKYVFLEVNPVGQFAMVSHPCNYFLEEIVAKKLASYEKREKN